MNVSPGQLARVRLLTGDCREVLKTLPAGSVHCCVTSPPYFGLRDYGHAGQIGLEPTPAEYVEQMVAVFREVRRVLRDDGTLWLNLGDSYGAVGGSTHAGFNERYSGTGGAGSKQDAMHAGMDQHKIETGLRPKNLIGIPWRVAFALQADGCADLKAVRALERVRADLLGAYEGESIPDRVLAVLERLGVEYAQAKGTSWYLRQDIIWHKPNPMPESVRDRCTKAHEYLFLLSKSERYWFDADAIAEQSVGRTDLGKMNRPGRLNEGGAWQSPEPEEKTERNRRSVWTVATQPYSGAHFATFPPALIEPCIKAGCPEGGTVLDPFGGAGTTGLVADRLQRGAVLIELNPAYVELQRSRITEDAPLFASLEASA